MSVLFAIYAMTGGGGEVFPFWTTSGYVRRIIGFVCLSACLPLHPILSYPLLSFLFLALDDARATSREGGMRCAVGRRRDARGEPCVVHVVIVFDTKGEWYGMWWCWLVLVLVGGIGSTCGVL